MTSLVLLMLLANAGSPVAGSSRHSDASALDETTTKALVSKFKASKHWAIKALAIIALGESWHPAGTEMIVSAVGDKEAKLRVYALEALLGCDKDAIKAVATRDLIDTLVRKQLRDKNAFYHDQVVAVLKKILPEVDAKDDRAWKSWWSKNQKDYKPTEWKAPEKKQEGKKGQDEPGKTVAERLLTRALDLNEAGLEVVICIDSTGSMQPTIDAARDGVEDIVALLKGVAPEFRLGLVHYRDYDMIKEGAEVLEALTDKVEKVRKRLADLKAAGGGDAEERVAKGLVLALDPAKIGWHKTTNKVVIIVGDAPPHETEKASRLVKTAFESPFDGEDKLKVRPFVTSAIGVSEDIVAPQTAKAFRSIAKAGGGAYGQIADIEAWIKEMHPDGLPEKVAKLLRDKHGANISSNNIVSQILVMAFGEEWRFQVNAFVEMFQKYRKAKYFN